MQDAKFKKLKREEELKSRLLSHEELISIVDSIDTGEFTDDLERKLKAHTLERKRREKQLKKQGKEIKDAKKRRKLNEKFEHLNDIFKKTELNLSEKTLKNGIIKISKIVPKNGTAITERFFLEMAKPKALQVLSENNDSKKVRLLFNYHLGKYRLLGNSKDIIEREDSRVLSSFTELFRGTDINELYENKKSHLLSGFAKEQLKGSGWVLYEFLFVGFYMNVLI